ncbi:ACP phosphodiesterase [Thalassomonas sp. RHCl1]|uniref:acyl carrier protein phosphodiesterase n=1 Tax=Thalassomonas sp. RHCl1 TaxID=2995320 RepID=UPI00248B0204|nr:ACP phosphodiesterase [Thalassomonas sp. RHCl1]
MNYLAHLFLAQAASSSLSPEKQALTLVGNLMGDFVKGQQFSEYPAEVVNGIYQHRLIDKYTDQHQEVVRLKSLLSTKRKRFSGIISDIVFDHFLAKAFTSYSSEPLHHFSSACYRQLAEHIELMPEKMQRMVSRMIAHDWLSGYQELSSVGLALDGVSRRIRFDNHLIGAIEEVQENYQAYQQAFEVFFPQLLAFVIRTEDFNLPVHD